METISVTKALVELKTLEKRITKQLEHLQPVAIMTGTRLETGIPDEKTYEKRVKAAYQSLTALVERKRRIKAAVVKSNAETEVLIAGERMSVAEAIERKGSIDLEKAIRGNLALKYAEKVKKIEKHNAEVQTQLFRLLQATYAKPESEISKEDYDRIAVPFQQNNEARLLDPLGLKQRLQAVEDQIDRFEAEVDVALSESNARTEITLP